MAQILGVNAGHCNGIHIGFVGGMALKKRRRIVRTEEVTVEMAETTVVRAGAVPPDWSRASRHGEKQIDVFDANRDNAKEQGDNNAKS